MMIDDRGSLGGRLFAAVLTAVLCRGLSWPLPAAQKPESPQSEPVGRSAEPQKSDREEKIIARLGTERARRRLEAFVPDETLNRLALRRGGELAVSKTRTPVSLSGAALEERLAGGGVYFRDVLEITAFIEKFDVEALFRVLFDDPRSAAGLADPRWDRMGIGITEVPGRGLYIVVDIIQTLEQVGMAAGRTRIQELVNGARERRGLSPIPFGYAELDEIAQQLALSRANGIPFAWDPGEYGQVQAIHLAVPGFQPDEEDLEEFLAGGFLKGGTGVWFGRTAEYRGGVYLFSFILIPRTSW